MTLDPRARLQALEVVARIPILMFPLPAHLPVRVVYRLVVLGPKPRQQIPFPVLLLEAESL